MLDFSVDTIGATLVFDMRNWVGQAEDRDDLFGTRIVEFGRRTETKSLY